MTRILALDHVSAADRAGRRGQARGRITDVSLSLGAGVHAIVGTPEDGAIALYEVVTGFRAPGRGHALVLDRDPAKSAAVRARIGAVGFVPQLVPSMCVRQAVELALMARGETTTDALGVLAPVGLQALADRRVVSLGFAEERAVELAIALSTPRTALVVLYEPLAEVAGARLADLRTNLIEHAKPDTCVLVITSSRKDAGALSDHIQLLDHGRLLDAAQQAPSELVAWVSGPGGRALLAALAGRPSLRRVSFKETGPGAESVLELRLVGDDLEAVALDLSDAAVSTGANIQAIATGSRSTPPRPPPERHGDATRRTPRSWFGSPWGSRG